MASLLDTVDPQHRLATLEALETVYGEPVRGAQVKELDHISDHYRSFIEAAPFMVLATVGPEGTDCSPRGDPPGFVRVHDRNTLLIPDRRGNNRLDSMSNIIANPNVGLIFLIPGVGETLRINGKARIVRDQAVLDGMAVNGKAPTSAILVEVEEAFLHCAKAIIRSKLWDDDFKLERRQFPTLGQMITDQVETETTAEEADAAIETAYKTNLY